MASTREGAELLSQLGYESCWRTREEMWPVIEDRSELLDIQNLQDIQDVRSESNYSMTGSIRDNEFKIHSPSALSSNLFFIEEEGKNGCDMKQNCDKNSNFDSSAYIPHRVNNRFKTLPFESRRFNTLPLRPQSSRSAAIRSERLRSSSDDTDKRFSEEKHKSESVKDDCNVKISVKESNTVENDDSVVEEPTTINLNQVVVDNDDKSTKYNTEQDELVGILKGTGSKQESGVRQRSATFDSDQRKKRIKNQLQNSNVNNNRSSESLHQFNVNVSVIPMIKIPSIDSDNREHVNVMGRSLPLTINVSVEPSKPVISNKKCNFNIGSDEEEDEDHKDHNDKRKDHIVKEASFHLPPHLRESKGNRSDSSKTSKSRTDSFNTDSTTSGIGSLESGPQYCGVSEMASLSPIASSSSFETLIRQNSQEKSTVHPSINRRRSLNLNRIPSLRKSQASPAYGILPSSRMSENLSSENAIMYTTTQDALGYSTWRSLRRQRTYSSDMETELGIGILYGDDPASSTLSRQSSVESKMSFDLLALRGIRYSSFTFIHFVS